MDTVITNPGTGTRIVAGPTTNEVLVPGAATAGALSAIGMHLPAGWNGPPPHVHERQAHLWYVLAGEVELMIDGRSSSYPGGSCLWVPPGVPHGFSTVVAATVLQVDTPALDDYFTDLASALGSAERPDPAAIAAVMARHDTRVVDAPSADAART